VAKERGLFYIRHKRHNSWVFMYRQLDAETGQRKQFKVTLEGGDMPRREAERKARLLRVAVDAGGNPALEKSRRRTPKPVVEVNAEADKDSVNARLDQFIARYITQRQSERTAKESIALLRLYVRPALGTRKVREVKLGDINDLLDSIVDRKAPVSSNRTLSLLKTAWRWFLERGYCESSPVHAVRKPHPEKPRSRILADHELAKIWVAVEGLGWPFQHILQLLILSGCRRQEVGEACWAEFDLPNKLWHIPGARRKRNIPLTVPLSDMAVTILKTLPRFSGDLLFPASRHGSNRAFSGYSKSKQRLDKLSGVCNWTLHDLRRTTATGLGNLGCRSEIIEGILGHVRKGIERVYQHHALLVERRQALQSWGRHIDQLLHPEMESNVVALTR